MQDYVFAADTRGLWWRRNWYLLQSQLRGRLGRRQAVHVPEHYTYLGNGWEWQAYLDTESGLIVKYPAGVFVEVDTPEYLESVRENYELLRELDPELCVETAFERAEGTNRITQAEIEPFDRVFRFGDLSGAERESLHHALALLRQCLDKYNWMPDVRPKYFVDRAYLSNLCWNEELQRLQLYDFSSALDLFRIDPKFTRGQKKYFLSRMKKIERKL